MVWDRGKCFEVLTNKYFDSSKRENTRAIFERTAVDLCQNVFDKVGAPYWFTDHGVRHSDHVLYFALQIARATDEWIGLLSELEAMALACACYLHDIGMAHVPEYFDLNEGWTSNKLMEIRSWHVSAIEEILPKYRDQLKQLYKWNPTLEDVLPMICKAHGTNAHKQVCQEFSQQHKRYGRFRGELLGKILLLADELDLAEHRSMVDRHPQFEQFPIIAKAHQFKHHYLIDVDCRLPIVRCVFVFPEKMSEEDKNAFMGWTRHKLKSQIEFISEGMVSQYLSAFEIDIQPEEGSQRIIRKPCPPEVCAAVKAAVAESDRKYIRTSEITKYRPNHFNPDRLVLAKQGELYPVLHRLMDDFFRECNTSAAVTFFRKIYIQVPENKKIGDELSNSLNKYYDRIKNHKIGNRLAPQEVFAITGPIGAGKSTILLYLANKGILRSRFYRGGTGVIVIHVDCLHLRSFVEVLRTMATGLAEECQKRKRIWNALKGENWTKYLEPATIAMLPEEDVLCCLRGILDLLHLRTSKFFRGVIPICFILDNIDRMPGFKLKCKTVEFAAKESKSRGYPFFVVTLRYVTKRMIDEEVDDIPAIATHSIAPPNLDNILRRRLHVAFSKDVAGKASSWCKPAPVESLLGRINLSFRDLRQSLMAAMETLANKKNGIGLSFIPAMAGSNMRSALTLYRAIVKSIDKKELLILSRGYVREHKLIKCAMLEDRLCYFESISKIRNLFAHSATGCYFERLYIIKFLQLLQRRIPDKGFIELVQWKKVLRENGISLRNFNEETWNLLCGELALLEIEGTDDTIPNDKFRNIDDLEDDVGVRISSAGEYYLSWLMYDLAYLQCVLQDTLMDANLAEDLSKPQSSVQETIRQVEKFIDFLEKRETEERIMWNIPESMKKFVSELLYRLELQKKSLISEERENIYAVHKTTPIQTIPQKRYKAKNKIDTLKIQ